MDLTKKTVILIPDSMAWVLGTWATEIRRWNSKKYRFVIFPATKILTHPSFFIQTARKADIVHCLSKWDFPMVRGLLDKNGVPGIKVISSIHHIIKDEPLSTNLDADRIMVVCNRYRDHILQMGVPAAKVYKIYNGVDTDEFFSKDRIAARKALGLPQDGLFIGFAGKFSSNHDDRKGIDIFTRVMEMVPPELQSTVRFAITGPGWADILQHLAMSADRIHYLSFIDRNRMPDFYNSLDIYLVTARVEGGPVPAIEAMSCGIPVISTSVGMVPDFIQNNMNGIMIDHDDAPGTIAAIRRLSEDAQLRRRIGEQARKTIVDNLQWRTTLSGMNGLYEFADKAHITVRGKWALTDAWADKLSTELINRDIVHWQRIFRNQPAADRQPKASRFLAPIKSIVNCIHFLMPKKEPSISTNHVTSSNPNVREHVTAVASPQNPKISVIMAVKDGQSYLCQAIDSILGQTFGDFEFIIVDDGSADGSLAIIENYADPRIKLTINRNHLGLSKSLNAGLSAARGEYIARMDADDICLPERFEKQVRFLDQHPQIAVLGTGIKLIDEQGKTIQDVQLPADNDLIKWQLCFLNPIAHPSVMMREAAVKQAGGYDPELVHAQDYDLWWRLSAKYQLANLPDILVLLRQHSGQVSNVNRSEQFEFGIKINQKHLSSLLGHIISKDAIRNLWTNKCITAEDALLSGQLILDYFQKISEGIQSRQVKHSLLQDATFKIHSIIGPFLKKPKIWFLLWRTFLMNPLPSIRFLANRVHCWINGRRLRMSSPFEKDPFPGKAKILFIALGQSSHTHGWIDLLSGCEFNVRLFSLPNGSPPPDWPVKTYINAPSKEKNGGFRKYLFSGLKGKFAFYYTKVARRIGLEPIAGPDIRLAHIIKKWRPDIIHVIGLFDGQGGLFYLQTRKKFKLEKYGRLVIQLSGGSDLALRRHDSEYVPIIRQALAASECILSDNMANIAYAAELGISPNKFAAIVPIAGAGGIELSGLSSVTVPPSKRERIIVWPKAYECQWSKALPVLEAIRAVWKKVHPFEIHMLAVSPDVLEWWLAMPDEIRRHCHISKRIPQQEVFSLLKESRIMLAPSLVDGVPNCLYEAMAFGALPVVSPLETITPVVKPDENVLFARNLYPEEITAALIRALTDDALVDRAAQNNFRLVEKIANRQTIKKQVAGFYTGLIDEKQNT